MVAKLVAEEGIQKGLTLSLEDGNEWVIGRDPDACQLLIEDPSASRKHLICKKTADGISIQNLSTTNPISVNDEEIQEPRLLRNGDVVKIGTGLYRFYAEDEVHLIDHGDLNVDIASEQNGHDNADFKEKVMDMGSLENSEASPSNSLENKPEENIDHETSSSEQDFEEYSEDDSHDSSQEIEGSKESNMSNELQEQEIEKQTEHASEDAEIHPKADDTSQEMLNEQALNSSIKAQESLEEEPTENHSKDHISIFEENDESSKFPEINFDLTETGRWLLKVVGGPNHGAEFTMQPSSTYIIGTDPSSCDIVFHDTSVSRQHAKITVNEDDTISLEDLKSRNGTFVDGTPLKGKQTIPTNIVIMIGTTSFVVYDREGEMQTIISPLLPSIVKVLQEEPKKEEAPVPQAAQEPVKIVEEAPVLPLEVPKKKEHAHEALGAFILIAIITGLFVIIGIGTTTLFKSQPVVSQQVIDPDRDLTQALSAFPNVKYSFNRSTGRLLLVGHVLTGSDKNQLIYNLQGMNYIRSIDDSGVIIDEGVWREINQVLSQNPSWKGISIHSPTPGHFVISGYLKTRRQAEQLWDYISTNFPYLDLLEKRVIVEEDVVAAIGTQLQSGGFRDISAQMNEGEVILSGHFAAGKTADFEKVLASIKEIPGVRNIKNFVTEQAPEQSMINISDKYEITGVSHQGEANTSVVINGRILTRGDSLDGMTITSIKPNAVFLEKEGTRYRIDYNR